MNLAIKGHPERGNKVIERLEMLGGINTHNLYGDESYAYYTIDSDNEIKGGIYVFGDEQLCHFTLEQFEEKFPYKVDDCVVNHKYGKGDIIQMLWIDNEIVYEIKFQDCTAYCKVNELCKYNASKGLLLQELTEYLSHTTREELDKTMEEIKIALAPFKVGDKVIVKGYEKMGEDEVIYVFETYEGDIKYKTKNHLDTHYFMEDSLTRVEQSNKQENYCQVIGNDTSSNGVNTSASSINEEYMEEKEPEPKAPILSNRYDYAEGKCGYVIPDGYEFDSIKQGFQTEIILRPIKPQYPKTYEECCDILDIYPIYNKPNLCICEWHQETREMHEHYSKLANLSQKDIAFMILRICRDAYWKIAGEEMGLGKPWEPDFTNNDEERYGIYTLANKVERDFCGVGDVNMVLSFPTEEMRDTFYKNFKELIENCKELL